MKKRNDDIYLPQPPGQPSPAAGVSSRRAAWVLSPFFVLFLLPLIMYVASLPALPLMEPDETRYALIPQHMNLTGDYVTPHLKGVAYLEKPPLAYWATAALFKVFGENAFAARLFAGVCAWGCILLAFNMGAFLYNRRVGIYSAAVLSVCLLPFALGRINILDMPLTFFLCLAIWCGYRFFASPRREGPPAPAAGRAGSRRDGKAGDGAGAALAPPGEEKPGGAGDRKWRDVFYGACALAFLTKGVIGAIFPPAVLVLWLLWSRRWREIGRLISLRGFLIFALPVGLWLAVVQRANPDFFWFFFIHEHFLRYTTKIHERVEPFWYYLPVLLLGVTPWWAYLVQAWAGLRRGGGSTGATVMTDKAGEKPLSGGAAGGQGRPPGRLFAGAEIRLFVVWVGFILLFFSLSSSKLASYIAPAVLPVAVVMGRIFQRYDASGGDAPAHDDPGSEDPGSGAGDDGTGGGEGAKRGPGWALAPVIVQSLALGGVAFVPLFVAEYRELGPPGGCVLSLAVPLLAAAALLFVPEMIRRRGKSGWFASIYLLFAIYLLSLLLPLSHYLTPGKSSLDVVRAVREHVPPPAPLYQYRMTMYGIDFYTGRQTAIVEDLGELKFGADRISPAERERRFPTEEEFVRAVKAAGRGREGAGSAPGTTMSPSGTPGPVPPPPVPQGPGSPPSSPQQTVRPGGEAPTAPAPAATETAAAVKTMTTGAVSFAVTEGKGNLATLQRSFPEARIVWRNSKFYLVALPR